MSTVTAVPQRHVEHCMGTVFSIDVRAPGVARTSIEDVLKWLHRVDAMFSTYRHDSQISRLGRGEVDVADCAPEVGEVLARCAELHEETGGYFDANFGGGLDPSGYVKGWAIERASALLAAAGSINHCVNGGGDVQCLGIPSAERDWQVGIAHPLRPGQLIATVTAHNSAVATSGTAERGRHITDPHASGAPNPLASVTVVGRRLATVDAYATAAFAMGARAEEWLAAKGVRALLVGTDGRTAATGPVLPWQPNDDVSG